MTTTLRPFVSDLIKQVIDLPTEFCTTKCPENLKNSFNISNTIKGLQQKYFKIIKEFDATKYDEVSVTYWMRELSEGCSLTDEDPDWEYVKNIVEGSMPHQIKLKLQLCGDIIRDDIEERVVC
jgi:hypothetical protein